MFETPEEIKDAGSKKVWTGIAVLVAVFAIGAYFFVKYRDEASRRASAASARTLVKGDADSFHDLKTQRATMSKDRNGTMAVWLVTVENRSQANRYNKISRRTENIGN